MTASKKVSLRELVTALLDESKPFPARYLHHFSDLTAKDQVRLEKIWPQVSLHRRQALMEDLEQLGDADDLLNFEQVCNLALGDSDPFIRARAIGILSDYEDIQYLPVFLDIVKDDEAAVVRAAAATALAVFVYMAEVELLSSSVQQKLEDVLFSIAGGEDDAEVRMRALEALGYTSREEISPMIEAAYKNGDRKWLSAALLAMGRSANPKWESKVMTMLDDKRPEVRAEAAAAVGGLESKTAVKRLLELLDDHDSQVRMAAIWSLSEIGGAGVGKALTKMLEKTSDEEEAKLLEEALDNLSFTDGSGGFVLFDIGEDDEEDDEDLLYFEDEVDVEG